MACTGTDKDRIQPFLPQRYWQAGQKSKCLLPTSCLEQPEPWQSMQELSADVRTDSLGSLVLLCCFGASWRCHKWFFLTSQSDAYDCKSGGNQWPVRRTVQVPPSDQHLTKKVWLEFISDRRSNFSVNNLLVPNPKLSFWDIYNEDSDHTCRFMALRQYETLCPLRTLMWPPGSLQLERGAERLGWVWPACAFCPLFTQESIRNWKKSAHGVAWLLSPKWLPVDGFSRAREMKRRRIEMFFWLSASFHTVLKLEGRSSPKPNLKRC